MGFKISDHLLPPLRKKSSIAFSQSAKTIKAKIHLFFNIFHFHKWLHLINQLSMPLLKPQKCKEIIFFSEWSSASFRSKIYQL